MVTLVNYNEMQPVKVRKVLKDLHTSRKGLTDGQVSKYQSEKGFNEITEKKKNPVLKFLKAG